ncbi:UNVERIFIED_CONTAM: hypothetical protein Sradi_4147400 [Sesamum radiatum]|uniref:DUF8040 domain-containing protein n=1 Tax=Sesamum radiatum TaxID=300843 RepID=A0AAW2P1N5_SESRA
MFARNTATGGIARSSAHPPPRFQTASFGDDEQMTGGNSSSRRSREDYEDTTFSQSQTTSTPDKYFSNTTMQSFTSPSSSKRPTKCGVSGLHSKKCGIMDKLNESLQEKIDRTGQKATESIECCVDELTKFKDLSDCVFTTALERFHSHSTRTIFLRLDDENKLRWLYSLGKGLLPHGQTSRVSSIEVVALFMQTVGMHKRQCDNMERFQHSLETINRRFDRVFSTLCAMAPELITRPNFTDTHSRVASNIDFYPEFKDCVGVMDGTLVPACVPQIYQNRYRSRKGRLSQNVLAICDFDMNFTYVYAGWESSAADARALNHVVSQDPTFPFSPIAPYRGTRYHLPEYRGNDRRYRMAYRRYLERSGFLQEDHGTLNVEQRLMWMIVDDNTRDSMRDDHRAEAHMAHWARGLRRYFGYHYTREQVSVPIGETILLVPKASLPQHARDMGPIRLPPIPVEGQSDARHSQNSNVMRSYARGGEEAPIMISNSTTLTAQTHTHIGSWDAVQQVAHGDGGPRLARSISLAPRRSLDMGSGVGGIGSWTDYTRHFGV